MKKSDWQPLTEIWESYNESIAEAVAQGFMDDADLQDGYIWPVDLGVETQEQSDVRKYVHERMTEIVDRINTQGGIDPNLIAGYIFRSVMCGMMWERERIGK